jgi:stringent starvation protein B
VSSEISQKPYLIRALWEWCNDQGVTPQILVEIDAQTHVPHGFDDDGKIVLDISMDATQNLELGNEWISFQARFGAAAEQIDVPINRIAAIFAAETGQGMGFEVTDSTEPAASTPPEAESTPTKSSPLKLVK